jgi:SAM-dependent methyltransferase
MAPSIKAVKKSVKRAVKRARTLVTGGQSVANVQEELRSMRRDLELTHGSIIEASSYLGRTLREVNENMEALQLRGGKATREVSQLNATEAELINFADGDKGFAAQSGLWLNPPVLLHHEEGRVRLDGVNERILEIPYVFRAVAALASGAAILDVGAAESSVSLSLASLGYHVTAVDLRGYPFKHPNLTVRESLLDGWPKGARFDGAVLLSAIEHFGLGAYGETAGASDADLVAMRKIRELLRPGGSLFLTVPYGKRAITPLQRIYDDETLTALLDGFEIVKREIGEKLDDGVWSIVAPSSRDCLRVALVTAKRPG